MKIVIIGAGINGLITALKLSEKKDNNITVLEKEKDVGGLSRTLEIENFKFDLGAHVFRTEIPEARKEFRKICDGLLLERKRKSSIFFFGKFFEYPFSMKELLIKLNPIIILRILSSYFMSVVKNMFFARNPASYKEYTELNFGKALSKLFFEPYAEKVWGMKTSLVSVELARRKIAFSKPTEVIRGLSGKNKAKKRVYYGEFMYPQKGIGQFSLKMKEMILSNGGEVYTDCEVSKAELDGNRIKAITFRRNGNVHYLDCDVVISTIPPHDLVRLINPKLEDRIFELADSLKFRAMLFVYFIINRPSFSDNAWLYFPEPKFIFNRIYEQKNYSPFVCPEDKTFFGAEISCDMKDALWQLKEEDLFKKTLENLRETGLVCKHDIKERFSARANYAYPNYDLGYKKRRDELFKRLNRIENLFLNGRQGLFNYNNMDHSIKMGMDIAELISSGTATTEKWLQITKRYDSYRIID